MVWVRLAGQDDCPTLALAVDDDGDGFDDAEDDCNKIAGTSTLGTYTGCVDSDGDGWADLEDSCPNTAGNSTLGGTLACPDGDGDGWADSDDDLPNDPTQWADSDGDGFGDNSSQDATNPDFFPNNIAATNDSDNDGYPDSFTEFYNGSNSGGLYIDGCPLVSGNSSNPLFGCLDSDGDSFMDIYSYDINPETGLRDNQSGDAFPFDPKQWSDLDGDGFGDFQEVAPYSNVGASDSQPNILAASLVNLGGLSLNNANKGTTNAGPGPDDHKSKFKQHDSFRGLDGFNTTPMPMGGP